MSANNQTKNTNIFLGVLFVGFLLSILYLLKSLDTASASNQQNSTGVSQLNGVQYIDVTAKGGYFPNTITAKANQNSILRVTTSATFDCSSSIVIPRLSYRQNLPPSGVTEIELPTQTAGSEIKGTCSMGMYRFNIKFI